ncbi:MAG: hypothetical protein ACOCWM_05605 [Cyclobacteriaceae bacterium]
MSNYSNKSELNFAAAELLHNESYYPSVIHSAYYSCYQIMAHTWFHVLGKSEAELMATKTMNEGSHEILINQMALLLIDKKKDYRTFNNSIGVLKKLRVKADYKDIEINYSLSSQSIEISRKVLGLIKSCM